jgi:hypothetical protein
MTTVVRQLLLDTVLASPWNNQPTLVAGFESLAADCPPAIGRLSSRNPRPAVRMGHGRRLPSPVAGSANGQPRVQRCRISVA